MMEQTLPVVVEQKPEPEQLTIEDVACIQHLTSQSFLLTNTQTPLPASPEHYMQGNTCRTDLTTPHYPHNI
jgi:hypothetical protein